MEFEWGAGKEAENLRKHGFSFAEAVEDVPIGVTLGDCTMREPKLKNLKVDIAETAKVRRGLKKQKSVKITINLDAGSLEAVKREASSSGIPYQRLLNRLLKESLASNRATESRIDRIERELREVKKRLVA